MLKQTAKQVAVNTAKQVAYESNEFLKSTREQIAPIEIPEKKEEQGQKEAQQEQPKPKDMSFLNDYKSELEQIRRDNLFKELQRKISEGEEIPLKNYIRDLSSEQREVLKAQMEAVKVRKEMAENAQKKDSFPQVISKKGRGMLNSFKKRNQQHVEMRQPPSG